MPTNFLWYTGSTAAVGDLKPFFTVMSTEMNSIANASLVVSTVSGSTGLFTSTNTAQGIWAEVFFNIGNNTITPTAGGNLSGWFLVTPDAGTTVESKTVVPARPPDFIVPLPASALATSSNWKGSSLVRLPAMQFYVLVQNNSGVTFASASTLLSLAPQAMQY